MNGRHHLFIFGSILVALSAAFAILAVSSEYRETHRLRTFTATSAIEERLSGVFAIINDFPGSAGKDMLFLRSLSSISALYSNFTTSSWHSAHDDLQQFIDRNPAYDEIHIHRSLCMFTLRRVQDENGDTSCSSPDALLQDAISHTLALPEGSVYVSPLVAYRRMVKGTESVIPALFYGTRVSAPDSTDGAIIAVVNADYFLEEVRRLKRPGESVFILNTDGSYIANPDPSKEALQGGNANFYADFPAVPPGTLSNTAIRTLDAGNERLTLMRITPTASNFALYDSASKQAADAGYWVLAAVSQKDASGYWFVSAPYLITVILVGMAHLFVIVLLFITIFPRMRRL